MRTWYLTEGPWKWIDDSFWMGYLINGYGRIDNWDKTNSFPPACLYFNYFAAYVCNIGSIWYFINCIDSILLIGKKTFLWVWSLISWAPRNTTDLLPRCIETSYSTTLNSQLWLATKLGSQSYPSPVPIMRRVVRSRFPNHKQRWSKW